MALVMLQSEDPCREACGSDQISLPQIRPLGHRDRKAIEKFFLRLDRETRLRRFNYAASDDNLRAHTFKALNGGLVVLGAFIDGRLLGVVELYSCAPAAFVEAAIVVEPTWRRKGVGTALLGAATAHALRVDMPVLRLVFARDNWPMRYLATKMNARLDLMFDELCAEFTSTTTGHTSTEGTYSESCQVA